MRLRPELWMRLRLHLVAGTLLALWVLSLTGSPTAPAGARQSDIATFVGRVEGTDAFIAVATDGMRLAAYVCDGDQWAEWLIGAIDEDGTDLVAATGTRLVIATGLGAPTGELQTADGLVYPFT